MAGVVIGVSPDRDGASDDCRKSASRDGDRVEVGGGAHRDDGHSEVGIVLALDADGVASEGSVVAVRLPAIEVGDEMIDRVQETGCKIAVGACQRGRGLPLPRLDMDRAGSMGLVGVEDVADRAAVGMAGIVQNAAVGERDRDLLGSIFPDIGGAERVGPGVKTGHDEVSRIVGVRCRARRRGGSP